MFGRIMLIEDSEADALQVKKLLREAGVEAPVYWIADGLTAMSYFSGEGQYANRVEFPLPEIVFLDLKMPEMDGYELLRWLRAQPELAGIIMIVLTAETHPLAIERVHHLGANSFLSKDANIADFKN